MSYGGFRLTLVFAFLTSNYVACNGPQCFSCSHVPAVEDCTHIQTCADNEVCFSKMVIDSSANVYYKLGCTANNTCQQNSLIGKRQGSVLSNREAYSDSLACFRCCIDNFCNEKLCNPNYSVSHDRLRCLDCNDVLNPEDCDQIRECDWNQLCFISLQHGTSNLRYQMRCMGELQCRGLERFQSIHISHPSAKCCNDKDFCNLSCLNTTTPTTTASETPCSPENRARNLNDCLIKVKGQLFNTSAYWFGNDYATDCPNGAEQGNIFCDNPRSDKEYALATRVFPVQLNLDLIDRYLEVTYSTGSGVYTGCGAEVTGPSFVGSIDPLADESVTPWETRQRPEFRFNFTVGEYYTVIFYDVGYLVPHAVYVNIQGNEIRQENEVKQYHGPLNALLRRNPYMFLVFKQTNQITVSQQWINVINTNANGGFLIPDFAKEYSLTGPIAVSWMPVVGDLYSAGLAESRQLMYTCPLYVSRALDVDMNQLSFLKPTLSVAVNVEIISPAFSYKLCCSNPRDGFPMQNWTVNPFSNKTVFTGYARTEANLSISFRKVGYYRDSDNFQADLFTLIVVDPDTPSTSVGTRTRPLLHHMVVNIRYGDISTGQEVASYIGPQPPDSSVHRYYFLLYKQDRQLVAAEMPSYAGNCPSSGLTTRCLYNINQLVYDKKMTLVGANVIRATYDDYVRYQRTNQSDSTAVDEACKTVPAFSDPCSGNVSLNSFSWLFIALTLMYFVLNKLAI